MTVGVKSVAVAVPSRVRRNDYWKDRYPQLVARAEEENLAKLWSRRRAEERNHFDQALEPYLDDPFRGAVERRILAPDKTGLTLEVEAAQRALEAAHWKPEDLDLLIVSSFLPDQQGPGNAAYVVKALELGCPGINLESACSSSLVALNTAAGLIRADQYDSALVLTSCTYSRMVAEDDTLSWFVGDGAGAILLGDVAEGEGWVASHTVHTASTCDTFRLDLEIDKELGPVPRMKASKGTARIINETGEEYMRRTCMAAMEKAGIAAQDLGCVVVNTPTAWYADFASAVLGVDRRLIVSTYSSYANAGNALLPLNLHASMAQKRLAAGDWVLLYAVGSVSTAVATVMRWSDVAVAYSEVA